MSFERQLARMAKGSARVQKRSAIRIAKSNRKRISELTELHYNEMAIQTTTTTVAGSVFYLSGIAVGNQVDDRIGSKIAMKEFRLNLWVEGDIASRMIRVIVFRDMHAQGASPAVTDVLSSASYRSQLNWANRARFSVLSDRIIRCNAVANDYDAFKFLKYSTKRPMNLEYVSDAEADTGAGKGAIFMLLISHIAGTANTIKYNATQKFLD